MIGPGHPGQGPGPAQCSLSATWVKMRGSEDPARWPQIGAGKSSKVQGATVNPDIMASLGVMGMGPDLSKEASAWVQSLRAGGRLKAWLSLCGKVPGFLVSLVLPDRGRSREGL